MRKEKVAGVSALEFHPLTPERWGDFEALFGKRGACGGCWCMWFRLTSRDFETNKGERNRLAMKRIVSSGAPPGFMAYHEERAVGWCAVAPRSEYRRLEHSRILKPLDDKPVWAVVCLFVAKSYRRRSVATAMLREAVSFVSERGGRIVEGYPVVPTKSDIPDVFAFHGLASSFRAAGFEEIVRRSPTRPIMRRYI